MIEVTRLNHTAVVINSDLIEQIESTPDTMITLTTGLKLMVLETTDAVVGRVLDFRQSITNPDSARRRCSLTIGRHHSEEGTNGCR